MAFRVAIPSLHREKILEKYTLSTLLKKGINPKQIDIWVANNQEKEKYETSIPSEMYNKIYVGSLGRMNQINHIRNYYPQKSKIMIIDDDISDINTIDNTNHLISAENLDLWSEFIFKNMKKYKSGICGVYKVRNGLFMSKTMTVGYCYIFGAMHYIINNKSPKLNLFLDVCEDYETSIKNYLYYGKTMTMNALSVKNESWDREDIQRMESPIKNSQAHKYLIKQYPDLVYTKENRILIRRKEKKRFKISEKTIERLQNGIKTKL